MQLQHFDIVCCFQFNLYVSKRKSNRITIILFKENFYLKQILLLSVVWDQLELLFYGCLRYNICRVHVLLKS